MKAGDFSADSPFHQTFPVPTPPEHRNVSACGVIHEDSSDNKVWHASDGVSEEYIKCFRGTQREECLA